MSAGIYLNMPPVKGESTDADHKGWLECESFDLGVSNPISMGSGQGAATTGRADFMPFTFQKIMDSASPDLNAFCAAGKKFAECEVHLCMTLEEKQTVYMTYKFKKCAISSVNVGGGGDQKPMETISIAYAEVEWKFTAYSHDGKKSGDFTKSHSLETNLGA